MGLTSTILKSDAEWSWEDARKHFESVDPELHAVVQHLANPQESVKRPAYESLSRAIMGQQLSTKAASTIWGRFIALHGGELRPQEVLATSAADHRSAGVSGQKHGYLMDLSRHYISDPSMFDVVLLLDDASVVASWTQVKGLGAWTVQMHLIFQLRRPDVFPVDDLGIRRAMESAFGISKDSKKPVYTKRAHIWGPFRTAASRFLWDSLNV